MRKKLIVSGLFIIAVLLCLPYFMGYLVERKVMEWNTTILSKMGIAVEVKEYHRYWFSSKVVLYLTIYQPVAPLGGQSEDKTEQSKGLLLISHIKHGPIIFDESEMGKLKVFFGQAVINSELVVPDEYKVFFAKYLNQKSLLDAQTIVHLDGSADSHLNSKQLQIKDPDTPGIFVAWDNLSSHWSLSRKLTDMKSKIHFDNLTLRGTPGQSFKFSNVSIEKKYSKGTHGLWFGQSKFQIPFMTMTINGKNRIVAKGLLFRSDHQQQDDVVNSTAEADLEQLIINERSYGPGDFQVALKNLDTEALYQMTEFLQAFGEKEEAWDESTKQKAISLLTQLLRQGFQFRINPFYLQTTDGEISIQAWLTLPEVDKSKLDIGLPLLVQKADASLVVSIPKVIVESALVLFYQKTNNSTTQGTPVLSPTDQAQAQINDWLANNILTARGNFYELSVAYKSSQLLVNGKPLVTQNILKSK